MPQTYIALTTWPRCRNPVGDGAKRVRNGAARRDDKFDRFTQFQGVHV
jgi:hypothetical protein